MSTSFQRARSDEQRAARKEAILDTAAAMLAEMPVAAVSLNELSRRVGLAKSNVLRYFESREAVLLDLLDTATRDWLADLEPRLRVAPDTAVRDRGDHMCATLAATLAARPVLCDLVGSQAAVLERNVSPDVAAQYKRAAIANVTTLADLIRTPLPELAPTDAFRFAGALVMTVGALWAHSHPSAAMQQAYTADPELAALRLDFEATLRDVLEILYTGILTRAENPR